MTQPLRAHSTAYPTRSYAAAQRFAARRAFASAIRSFASFREPAIHAAAPLGGLTGRCWNPLLP